MNLDVNFDLLNNRGEEQWNKIQKLEAKFAASKVTWLKTSGINLARGTYRFGIHGIDLFVDLLKTIKEIVTVCCKHNKESVDNCKEQLNQLIVTDLSKLLAAPCCIISEVFYQKVCLKVDPRFYGSKNPKTEVTVGKPAITDNINPIAAPLIEELDRQSTSGFGSLINRLETASKRTVDVINNGISKLSKKTKSRPPVGAAFSPNPLLQDPTVKANLNDLNFYTGLMDKLTSFLEAKIGQGKLSVDGGLFRVNNVDTSKCEIAANQYMKTQDIQNLINEEQFHQDDLIANALKKVFRNMPEVLVCELCNMINRMIPSEDFSEIPNNMTNTPILYLAHSPKRVDKMKEVINAQNTPLQQFFHSLAKLLVTTHNYAWKNVAGPSDDYQKFRTVSSSVILIRVPDTVPLQELAKEQAKLSAKVAFLAYYLN